MAIMLRHIASEIEPTRVQEVPEGFVDAGTRAAAAAALEHARRDLALPSGARLRWFVSESPESARMRKRYGEVPWTVFELEPGTPGVVRGKAHTDVWLDAGIGADDVAWVVLHECRHVRQYQDFIDGRAAFDMTRDGDPAAEQDADLYAAKAVGQLGSATAPVTRSGEAKWGWCWQCDDDYLLAEGCHFHGADVKGLGRDG